MVVDPGTAILVATAVASAMKGGTDAMAAKKAKKMGKVRAKETKRETFANILNDSLQNSAELHAHGLKSSQKMGKARANSLSHTSDLVRGALNI